MTPEKKTPNCASVMPIMLSPAHERLGEIHTIVIKKVLPKLLANNTTQENKNK